MKTLADFHDYYLADITGCTYFAAENELRKAAQEFCEKTKVAVVNMEPVLLFTGVDTYQFDVTKQQVFLQLEQARIDTGEPLKILLRDQPEEQRSIQPINDREFKLIPSPSTGQKLYLRASTKPSNTATQLDDDLYDQYAEAIASGAKARLMMQLDKPYTNVQMAMVHRTEFDYQIGRAQIRVAKSFSNAPLRTTSSFF